MMQNNIEATIESDDFTSVEFGEINTPYAENNNIVVKTEQQKSLDFSAGAGLFIIISLFFMFFLTPVAALISFGFNIDLLPIVITIMTTTAVVASFYLLLHVIDKRSK